MPTGTYNFNFNWIPPRVPETEGLNRQTEVADRENSDIIGVLFFLLEVGVCKNDIPMYSITPTKNLVPKMKRLVKNNVTC